MASNNFSEVDMMILAKMAYFNPPGKEKNNSGDVNIKLEKMIKSDVIQKELKNEFGNDLIESFKEKVGTNNYVITKAVNDRDKTGFAALAITGPDPKTVTVATRGTEGFTFDYDSKKDDYTDSQLAHKIEANQQKEMNKFLMGMEKYDRIYMTAHSLGGNLIVSGAIKFPFPEKIKGVATFNAPGQNAAFLTVNYDGIQKVKDKITNYQNQGDGVSDAMKPVGKVVVIKSKIEDSWKAMFGDNHLLKTIAVKNGSFIKVSEGKSMKHKLVQGIAIKLTNFICLYKFITMRYLQDFIPMVMEKVKNWFKSLMGSNNKPKVLESQIKVDTYKLRNYSQRLQSVNKKLGTLEKKLNSLYAKVGVLNPLNMMQPETLTNKSFAISRCVSYLEETANDFESAERNILNRL